jgi:hypothetical protein
MHVEQVLPGESALRSISPQEIESRENEQNHREECRCHKEQGPRS